MIIDLILVSALFGSAIYCFLSSEVEEKQILVPIFVFLGIIMTIICIDTYRNRRKIGHSYPRIGIFNMFTLPPENGNETNKDTPK
jgi:MFS-type transporter involved in bile tolerance (Atg22 family)